MRIPRMMRPGPCFFLKRTSCGSSSTIDLNESFLALDVAKPRCRGAGRWRHCGQVQEGRSPRGFRLELTPALPKPSAVRQRYLALPFMICGRGAADSVSHYQLSLTSSPASTGILEPHIFLCLHLEEFCSCAKSLSNPFRND